MQERLQKIIARAGVASRRRAEELIRLGQVTVNGQVVTELGSKADAETDSIKVSGKLLRMPEQKLYIALHKPAECVSTMSDPEGRKTLPGFLHGVRGRVFPVGRLEYHASGLLLLTNDGDFANQLLQSGERLAQKYLIKVKGTLSEEERRRLQQATGARLSLVRGGANAWYEVALTEARRSSLGRELERAGHPVEKIRRVAIGPVELGSLPPGSWRELSEQEVRSLSRAAQGIGRGRMPAGTAGQKRFSRHHRKGTRRG